MWKLKLTRLYNFYFSYPDMDSNMSIWYFRWYFICYSTSSCNIGEKPCIQPRPISLQGGLWMNEFRWFSEVPYVIYILTYIFILLEREFIAFYRFLLCPQTRIFVRSQIMCLRVSFHVYSFVHPSIHPSNKYLPRTFFLSGTKLDARTTFERQILK